MKAKLGRLFLWAPVMLLLDSPSAKAQEPLEIVSAQIRNGCIIDRRHRAGAVPGQAKYALCDGCSADTGCTRSNARRVEGVTGAIPRLAAIGTKPRQPIRRYSVSRVRERGRGRMAAVRSAGGVTDSALSRPHMAPESA